MTKQQLSQKAELDLDFKKERSYQVREVEKSVIFNPLAFLNWIRKR